MSASRDLSPIAACLAIAHRRGVELARLLLDGSVQAERAEEQRAKADDMPTAATAATAGISMDISGKPAPARKTEDSWGATGGDQISRASASETSAVAQKARPRISLIL